MREILTVATKLCQCTSAQNCCVKFTVKKIIAIILGPRKSAAPRIAGSAGSVVTPLAVSEATDHCTVPLSLSYGWGRQSKSRWYDMMMILLFPVWVCACVAERWH